MTRGAVESDFSRMGHYREKKQNILIAHLLGEILRFATARGRAVPTSTKQKFVTTGIDLLETCQAAFLNINE